MRMGMDERIRGRRLKDNKKGWSLWGMTAGGEGGKSRPFVMTGWKRFANVNVLGDFFPTLTRK
eukprot:767130-Hanusia_phi.AAC.2